MVKVMIRDLKTGRSLRLEGVSERTTIEEGFVHIEVLHEDGSRELCLYPAGRVDYIMMERR